MWEAGLSRCEVLEGLTRTSLLTVSISAPLVMFARQSRTQRKQQTWSHDSRPNWRSSGLFCMTSSKQMQHSFSALSWRLSARSAICAQNSVCRMRLDPLYGCRLHFPHTCSRSHMSLWRGEKCQLPIVQQKLAKGQLGGTKSSMHALAETLYWHVPRLCALCMCRSS